MINDKLTEKIIGAAFTVFNQIGFGFLESVYQKSMLIELRKQGLLAEAEIGIPVFYDGISVGDFYADIIVNREIIIEIKSVQELNAAHEVQLVNYLTATGKDVGLLMNFGQKGVTVKRKYRKAKDKTDAGDWQELV